MLDLHRAAVHGEGAHGTWRPHRMRHQPLVRSMARSKDDYPDYTPGDYVAAILSLTHYGATALAVLSLVGGALFVGRFLLVGLVLLSLAGLILASQLISRLRHIRNLVRVRHVHGMVEIWSEELEAWIPGHCMTRITRKQFPCADAWRPITSPSSCCTHLGRTNCAIGCLTT